MMSEFSDPGEPTQAQDGQPTQAQTAPPGPDRASPPPPAMTLEEWVQKLKSADRAFYNIMAMEVWSIAKSMDSLVPGFWAKFMENRRVAMQKFVVRKKTSSDATRAAAKDAAKAPFRSPPTDRP
jgi:hypothetical protein